MKAWDGSSLGWPQAGEVYCGKGIGLTVEAGSGLLISGPKLRTGRADGNWRAPLAAH